MVTPQSPATVAVTPAPLKSPSVTPGFRVLDVSTPGTNRRNSLSDEAIWRKLKEAGFDEESIRRRDKAALIAYIAKLEAEIYDVQHHMGLLILEKKDWTSKYEEIKLSAESAEMRHKLEQAALSSALAEARKREDTLKKAVGVEKECVANIEKALHEMRAESAEVKIAAESKMAEARNMVENAQNKYIEAKAKQQAAQSLQDEASRSHRAAERKIQEVEAREDDLRRRTLAFKSDCEAKEKEIMLERQSLSERLRTLTQAQDRLLEGQTLLNQREAELLRKSQELKRIEKELEAAKENLAAERRALLEEKSTVELKVASVSEREKAVIEKEALLAKKEQELVISLEKAANKEHNDVQKLVAEQENVFKSRMTECEAELEMKRKAVEEESQAKRRAWELRELDLKHREDIIREKEQDLEVLSRAVAEKDSDMAERMKLLEEKENYLNEAEKEVEVMKNIVQKEKEEIGVLKRDLEKSFLSLEEKREQVSKAETNLEVMKCETSELLVLETKLKEEIDMIRAQKLELEAEADKLKVEKAKFETEWEVIDEKRAELQREEERIAEERMVISKFLKDERDSINMEKAALRDQYRHDLESLSRDRGAFLNEIQRERSEWFAKVQQERADFLLDIEIKRRALEDCVEKRREEIESYLKEKESAFEQEKNKELQYVNSCKEALMKEKEEFTLEMKRLETERLEIKLDREHRDRAWAELNSLIEELKKQREKLKKQRELLHADREEIFSQIEQLNKLEDIKLPRDIISVPETKYPFQQRTIIDVPKLDSTPNDNFDVHNQDSEGASPSGSTISWIKRCASLIFKHSPDKPFLRHEQRSSMSELEDKMMSRENGNSANGGTRGRTTRITSTSGEPKVIHEVPSLVGDIKEMHVDPDTQMNTIDAAANLSWRISGQKRRVEDSFPLAADTLLEKQTENKRKRKQQGNGAHVKLQDVAVPRMESMQASTVEDEQVMSSLQDVSDSDVQGRLLHTDEGFTRVTKERISIEEIFVVDGGEGQPEEVRNDPEQNKQEHKDPTDANSDKQ